MESTLTAKKKKIILCAVFALAAFLLLFHFTDTPRVWLDEGVFTEMSRNFALHGVSALQTSPGAFFPMGALATSGYPLIVPVAMSLKLFGIGIVQARLPMILYMLALTILYYLFAKKRYGFYPAILSVLMLLSFSPFYGNGRPVQGEVPGLVFLVLGCLWLLFWEERDFQDTKWALLSGLAFGLSAASKPLYLLVLLPVFIITLIFWIKKIPNKKKLLVFAAGFLIPLIVWLFFQFPSVAALSQIVPVYSHLISNHEASVPIIETIVINLKRFFTESTPILFLLLLLSISFSFLFRFSKKRNWNVSISECVLISFIVVNWGAYLIGTGWYRYFFPAATLLYLLFPAAVLSLRASISKEIFRKVLFVIPIVLIIVQFFDLVFLSDNHLISPAIRNSQLSSALSVIGPTQSVLFYNTIEATIFFKGENYSQFLTIGDSVDTGNKDTLQNPSTDFVLTDESVGANLTLSCYDKKPISKYYLFQKQEGCQK